MKGNNDDDTGIYIYKTVVRARALSPVFFFSSREHFKHASLDLVVPP